MKKIGITGGIGSGKTTVCKFFEILGIPVFYADTAAKQVMDSDLLLKSGLIDAFGKDVFNHDGLNRKHLANIVFNDKGKLQLLNSLVHPAVFRSFDAWVAGQNAPYVLKEAALLFESGSYKACDETILVKAPLELKLKRVIKRDSISAEEVKARMDRQMSDQEKAKLSGHLIINDELNLVIPQVLSLHHYFLS
ncbi:dephospho-CoA kinase [Pedobacter sp. HMF7647]|uniref:Dephospho-CoA kinase n=1 Tax=Hufsiella arboris TaxID=2695275 RepID=A0A7K1YDN1_9SPHI|nr:dephospho-CoA kinase [Hufsiella arboris]MXV52500.1 dephospho-CoA kinase [Hufsiella arboris]